MVDVTDSLEPASIVPGCRAIITGLQSKPEFNGKEAGVLAWVAEKGRWAVVVVGSPVGITLKPSNLTRSPCSVQLLDDEALTQVLVQTEEPAAVTKVCQKFNSLTKQPSFKADRIRLDFANVSVRLDPREDFDEEYEDDEYEPEADLGWGHDLGGHQGDYGCTRNFSATIRVDGEVAGGIGATLLLELGNHLM